MWEMYNPSAFCFLIFSLWKWKKKCMAMFLLYSFGWKTFGWETLTLTAQQQHIYRPVYYNQTLMKPFWKQFLFLCVSSIPSNFVVSVLICVLLWANLFSMILSCSLGSLLQLRLRMPKAWAPNTICLWNNSSIWIYLLICPGTHYMCECTRPTFPTPFISAHSLRQVINYLCRLRDPKCCI